MTEQSSAPYEQRVVLILVDISGYTKFMVANRLSAVHGQICIDLLIETILKEVDIPLQLQEIEGDALFLYAAHPGDDKEWSVVLGEIRRKLLRFFEVFFLLMAGGAEATPCHCRICKNVDELKLKIVVHTGSAVFHTLAGKRQVSGTDVIWAHRLLKNRVPCDEYILMSAAAYQDIGKEMEGEFEKGQETYEALGTVETYTRYLGKVRERRRARFFRMKPSRIFLFAEIYAFAGAWRQIAELARRLTSPWGAIGLRDRARFLFLIIVGIPSWLLITPFSTAWKLMAKRKA